jgi:transposase-like protein
MDQSDHDQANAAVARRRWTAGEKIAIVEESVTPGSSVRAVASKHGVSASQVYRWARQYGRDGAAQGSGTALVPVKVAETDHRGRIERNPGAVGGERLGSLNLEVGNARVVVHGAADLSSLRLVLDYLLG